MTQDLIAVRHVLGSTRAEVAGSEIGGFCPSLSHKHNRPHYCPISGDKSPATVSPSFQETQLSRAGEIYTDGEKVTKNKSLCFLFGRSFSFNNFKCSERPLKKLLSKTFSHICVANTLRHSLNPLLLILSKPLSPFSHFFPLSKPLPTLSDIACNCHDLYLH